jgi:hypothetical protein
LQFYPFVISFSENKKWFAIMCGNQKYIDSAPKLYMVSKNRQTAELPSIILQ